MSTFATIRPLLILSMCNYIISPYRYAVPVDVLAKFQLCHHRPRWWTTQNSHQHLHCSRFLCPHHRGHLQHVSEGRKTGYGNVLAGNVHMYNKFVHLSMSITIVLFYLTGTYPECHSCRWRCHGNISWVHDHSLWCADCGFLLWHHLHIWLSVCLGEENEKSKTKRLQYLSEVSVSKSLM